MLICNDFLGNFGCNGGIMCRAFEYAANIPGVATEESYPYVGDVTDFNFKSYLYN